jgi:2-haloalkanoic acid dehalogenase type II
MSRDYDIVTFDCYGTLIDWESGIGNAFIAAAAGDGVRLDRKDVLLAHAEIEPVVQSESFRSYREVLRETARRMAIRLGWKLDDAGATFLPESLPRWEIFDDTNPALGRLHAAGYRLGILSNVDDDLLARTLEQFRVPFDLLVTAQQVGSYKPAHGHFVTTRARVGRWLHAAQSYYHDVEPAVALGIPVAWINRKGEKPFGESRPDRELRDLSDLADWLAPTS